MAVLAEIVSDRPHYTGARSFVPGETVQLAIQPQQVRVLARQAASGAFALE